MRYGITLLGNRVAPRSTFADTLLVVVCRRNHARAETTAGLSGRSLLDLAKVLSDYNIDILICGGISREERDYLTARSIGVIDNVAASADELLAALDQGSVPPGFGLNPPAPEPAHSQSVPAMSHPNRRPPVRPTDPPLSEIEPVDCLACRDRVCLNGERCQAAPVTDESGVADRENSRIMEAALDISFENERTLCRLSELIYFCLEMRYGRIGLAYCVDLEEPAEILARVLRRFFEVHPVCCQIGGAVLSDPLSPPPAAQPRPHTHHVACNPTAQAETLNRIETDINVLVGLCMGADCIFTRLSDAPVTTLFVKDKSLANNPIGAVYSDYYIKEAIQAAPCGPGKNS